MDSPKELLNEDRPVYAPEDDSPLSAMVRRRPVTIGDYFRACTPKNARLGIIAFLLCCLMLALFISTVIPFKKNDQQIYAANANLPSTEDVKFFMVGFRHGNRNPAQFLKNDKSHDIWAWEGPGQLTSIGKRQVASLGAFLRHRYEGLVPAEFYPSQVKAYSSSADRCQQSMQSFMAGFFPPKGRSMWSTSVAWQPIPYEINDHLLRMNSVSCPEYNKSYQAISDDSSPEAYEWLTRDKELVKYISKYSGLNGSLGNLGDVADNIINMKLFNYPLPRWVREPSLPGFPPKDMVTAIQAYAEARQVLCANDSECSRIMAGFWLDSIIQTLEHLRSGKLKDRLAHFYVAHTETILSLIRLVKAEVAETPTSAGFILEYTDVPQPSVRFIFHEPDPHNPDIRRAEVRNLPYCADQDWCDLDVFIQNIEVDAFSDWQLACKLPRCPI